MKPKRLNSQTRNSFLAIFIIIAAMLLNACATKVSFLTSSVVPAARGTVKIKVDNNKNYSIDITLSDLAEVSRLEPSKRTYVVWMVTEQEVTKNIGQLNSSKGFMSKRLKGSFKTVSSAKPIKIFITAEDDPNTQYPGNLVALTTDTFRP
jgi:hypothetical protein